MTKNRRTRRKPRQKEKRAPQRCKEAPEKPFSWRPVAEIAVLLTAKTVAELIKVALDSGGGS